MTIDPQIVDEIQHYIIDVLNRYDKHNGVAALIHVLVLEFASNEIPMDIFMENMKFAYEYGLKAHEILKKDVKDE